MNWLNETFPTRVIVAFAGGAFRLGLVEGARTPNSTIVDHSHDHKMRVAYLGKF
jgi:hypothetical protein